MVNVTVTEISTPVTAPSPSVCWFGSLLIPFSTEFAAVKLAAIWDAATVQFVRSRIAKATSEGEFARVGTWIVRTVSESCRNTLLT